MEDIKKLEELILKYPGSYPNYKEILSLYFYKYPELVGTEAPKKIVFEIINRFSSEEGEWQEWASHFLQKLGQGEEVVRLWKKIIEKPDVEERTINNAGIFCMHLDSSFSAKCFALVNAKHPNDLETLENLAQTLSWANNSTDAFNFFKKRMLLSKEINPYVLMEGLICAVKTNNLVEAGIWAKKISEDIAGDEVTKKQIQELLKVAKVTGYLS